MRFHGKGGALPTILLPGYKTAPDGVPTNHGADVIVMRYARDDDGRWPVDPPAMRLHRAGPLQRRLMRTGRHLPPTQRPPAPSALRRPAPRGRRRRPRAGGGSSVLEDRRPLAPPLSLRAIGDQKALDWADHFLEARRSDLGR